MVDSVGEKQGRRPRISREFLEQHRRRRYVDATAELLHEFGRQGPSVDNIVRLAGTARNSFYEVFDSAEDCIGYGIGVAVEELFATLDAQDGEGEWLREVDESIAGFYRAVAAEPILAELFLIHSHASRVDHGRTAGLAGAERFVALFGRGHEEAENSARHPPSTLAAEFFSRATVSLAARRVGDAEVELLPDESRMMAELIGGFYLGSAAAEAILPGTAAAPAGL